LVAANSFNRTPQARAFLGVHNARACGVRLNDRFINPSKQCWGTSCDPIHRVGVSPAPLERPHQCGHYERAVNGFLNIDKPLGLTSRAVVDQVQRLLRERGLKRREMPKVGHAGTLDPLATGVLVVCIGNATRLIDLVHSRSKEYRGTFLLGRHSDTEDVTGQVVDGDLARAASVSRDELETALATFLGRIEQVPPAFSAVKVEGQRAYELARRGDAVTLAAKTVEVHRLMVVRFEPPELTLEIECGSGTYIRSIGRDLGERLGCGAVMSALCRTRIGPFKLSQAISLDQLTNDSLDDRLQPCSMAAMHLPAYVCDGEDQDKLSHGLGIVPRESSWLRQSDVPSESFALVDAEGTVLAIGGWDRHAPVLRPRINFIGVQ
jgi:tRNA pseudouridine55 synthase